MTTHLPIPHHAAALSPDYKDLKRRQQPIAALPDAALVEYIRNQNTHLHALRTHKPKSIWNDQRAADHIDRVSDAFLSNKIDSPGFLPKWALYSLAAIVPVAMGLLTATALRNSRPLIRIASGLGAAIGTGIVETVTTLDFGVANGLNFTRGQQIYDAKENLSLAQKELARRTQGGTPNLLPHQ